MKSKIVGETSTGRKVTGAFKPKRFVAKDGQVSAKGHKADCDPLNQILGRLGLAACPSGRRRSAQTFGMFPALTYS